MTAFAAVKLRHLVVAGCALFLYFGGLGTIPLLEPDEGRYAEIPREMLATGDFVTPRLNGVLYFEKPPLYYWLGAASRATFASQEFAARFWSALFGLLGVALACLLARSMAGPRAGMYAAAILATTPLHLTLSRANIIDPTLTFFLDGALVCFWLAQRRDRDRLGRFDWLTAGLWHGMFAASALAVLSKGLIGIVIPGAVIGLYIMLTWQWEILKRVPWATGILLFLAIAVPWHVLVARRNPDFLWFYFVHEQLLRYATPIASREQPFWFFAAVLLPGLLPWWGLLPGAARLFRPLPRIRRDRRHLLFLLVWAGFVFVFFSASESKLIPYILPAVLPISVVAALSLEKGREEGDLGSMRWGMALASLVLAAIGGGFLFWSLGRIPWSPGQVVPVLSFFGALTAVVSLYSFGAWLRRDGRRAFWAAGLAAALFLGCLWAAAGPRGAWRTTRELAVALDERLRSGDEVFYYRGYSQTLPPYLGRLVGAVGYRGELQFGISRLAEGERARRYPTVSEFRPIWESEKTVYLVTEDTDLPLMEADGLHAGRVLKREGTKMLLVNR